MNPGAAAAGFALLALFTAILLRYYAAKGTHFVYLLAVFMSWFMGFAGTMLLPVDVEQTIERDPLDAFEDMWMFVYWGTFICSWVVLPVLMEFQASGAFTFKQRLVESLKANLKFYAIILATGLVIVIWMAIYNNLGPSALSATMVAAANTYGMLLIVVMLGYGLVEVPRIMWNNTNAASALKRLEYMAPELEEQLFDARQDMDECVAQALHLDGLISSTSRSDDDVNLRECMDIVMKIVPSANTGAMAAMRATGADKSIEPSFKSVSKLHTRLKAAIPQLNKCEARWASLLREAAELQAIIDGADQPSEYDSQNPDGRLTRAWRRLRWFYKSRVNRWFGKLVAIALGIMSILVLWCEFAIPLPWDLSLFGLLIGSGGASVSQVLLCFVPFAYMSWCMYLALFRVKLLNAISLTAGRLTNAYTLMFNASYLCRLQFVLAYNYLLMIKTDALSGHKTAFENTVGENMELVPIFGTDFNNFIPVLLLVFALFTLFRLVDRIVRKVGIEGFGEYVAGRPDHEERRAEGREFIRKAQDRQFRKLATASAPGRVTRARPAIDMSKLQRARERAAQIRGQAYTPPAPFDNA